MDKMDQEPSTSGTQKEVPEKQTRLSRKRKNGTAEKPQLSNSGSRSCTPSDDISEQQAVSPKPSYLPILSGVPRSAMPSRLTAPVHIDIGGCIYTSTLDTLTIRCPDSRLAKLFNGTEAIILDTMKQHYFLDRDGPSFRHILNYLRGGKLILPGNFTEINILMEECRFFELDEMLNLLTAHKQKQHTCIILHKQDDSCFVSGQNSLLLEQFPGLPIESEVGFEQRVPLSKANYTKVIDQLLSAGFHLESSTGSLQLNSCDYIFIKKNT